MSWKRKFLTKDEETNVEKQVKEFEEQHGAELIICVARESDPYPASMLRTGFLLSLTFTLLTTHFLEMESLYWIYFQAILFILCSLISHFRFIKKLGLTKFEKDRESFEKARELFFEHASQKSGHKKLLFLYISLLEKKIHLLIGEEIASQLSKDELTQITQEVRTEFKNRAFQRGLIRGIETLSNSIKSHFPEGVSSIKTNDYSDSIIWYS